MFVVANQFIELLLLLTQFFEQLLRFLFFALQIHEQLVYRFFILTNFLARVLHHPVVEAYFFCNFKRIGTTGAANFQFIRGQEVVFVKKHGAVDQAFCFECKDFEVGIVRRDHPENLPEVQFTQHAFRNGATDFWVGARSKFVNQHQGAVVGLFQKQSRIR